MTTEGPRLAEFKRCDESFRILGPHRWNLNARFWRHEGATSKGTIVGIHGYSEHSDRYAHFAAFLNRASWDVVFIDLPGHGLSDGRRSNIDNFQDYVSSVEGLVTEIERRKLPRPYHLFAHSLGGLVATRFVQSSIYSDRFQSLTLSSPLFGLANYKNWMLPFLRIFTSLMPNLTLKNDDELGTEVLARDEKIMQNRLADPLIKSQVTFHWTREFLSARSRAFCEVDRVRLSTGVFQAGDERVVSRGETERFFSLLKSKKMLKIYDGLLHEILNEVERSQVMSDILQWIESQNSEATV